MERRLVTAFGRRLGAVEHPSPVWPVPQPRKLRPVATIHNMAVMVDALCRLPSILCLRAAAQYSIDWCPIAGGGSSQGGVYALSVTIGQSEASGPMTNGQYSVTGGFWVLPGAVQTPDAPTLYITNAAPGFATLWWVPSTPSFTLQSTASLSPASWSSAPSTTNNPATVPATPPARFYRLVKP